MLLPLFLIWFCNNLFVLRCMRCIHELLLTNDVYVESLQSWLVMVWIEIPWDFVDYRGYMGSSLRIWSLQRLFLDMCSYNLDDSVTAGIGARFNTKHIICVFKQKFCENLNSNLKSASGHILCAQIRTIRWLIKVLTWGFLFVFLFHCPYGVLLYGCHPLGW
jgi:hypothetical protein